MKIKPLQNVPKQIKLKKNKEIKGQKITYSVAEKIPIPDKVNEKVNSDWRVYEEKPEELRKLIDSVFTRPELTHLKRSYSFSRMFPKTYDIHRILLNVALNVGP